MKVHSLASLLVLCSMTAATRADDPTHPTPDGNNKNTPSSVADSFYILQPESTPVDDLSAAGFDWLILEPTTDGSASTDFTPQQIAHIRNDGPCPKRMLAYLSIGEAEDYRDYWDDSWVDENGDPIPGVAPDWLGPIDPDWPGNYKVRYWDPDWHAILWGTPTGQNKTPLDRIIDQDFDGVYLDIIDAYEFWSGPDGGHELTRAQARSLMIDLIQAIGDYAHINHPDFLVFPQNASEIILDDNEQFDAETDRYFAAIDGLGQEDLFYDELTPQPPADVAWVLGQLREYVARHKTVLVTDYVINAADQSAAENAARVDDLYTRCRAESLVPHAAVSDRDLNEIVTFSGGAWPVAQPTPGCVHAGDCPADINGDTTVNSQDFVAFLNLFVTGDPAADFNGDGSINSLDFTAFLNAFVVGC